MTLFLITCLLGQFVLAEIPSPSIDEFKVICQDLKQQQIAFERDALERLRPTTNQIIRLTREERLSILKVIREKDLELKKIERDADLLPVPRLIVQTLEVGQVGELYSTVAYTDRVAASRESPDSINVERIETRPATLIVVKTFRPKTLVCLCDNVEVVLTRYKGPTPAKGETIQAQGFYRVSGHYTTAGKTFLAIEPWDHNTEWQRRFKRPQPTGVIDIVSNPQAAPAANGQPNE